MFQHTEAPDQIQFSVVIPARDEQAFITGCINSIKQSYRRYQEQGGNGTLEIIVVDNFSTDNTADLARELGCKVCPFDGDNLSRIRNYGVRQTRGTWILTVDADSVLSENTFTEVTKALSNEKSVGGGMMIWPERYSFGIILTGLVVALYFYFYRISMGCFYFRRTDFEEINGFNEELVSAEDIDFARRLKRLAARTERKYSNLFSCFITTSCRKFDHFGDWYFILRPYLLLKLLLGRDRAAADKIWYHFKH